MINELVALLTENPVYLILAVGGASLMIILLVVRRIHKIRSEEIFVHQAWGANWKGR
ncbi:MAG TPA: hypothetical protein VJ300_04325 [Thermoplasmata archaeon]|nr:hypothetical protein [Thermoplasmata archaeon]